MTDGRTPCIVGIGSTPFGELYRNLDPERSAFDLAADAFHQAVEDSGFARADIDSVIVGRLPSYLKFCADAGIRDVRYVNFQHGGGNQSGMALNQAVALIESGMSDVIACVYGNNGRSVRVEYGGAPIPTSRYEDPYGMTSNGAYYGMMFRRHQYEFGTPNEALAEIAISNRANAALNPDAVMRTPITRDDYFRSRYVTDPLRLLDYCLINDGGVAYIVTTFEKARTLKHAPIKVLSSAIAGAMTYYYGADDFWFSNLQDLASRLWPRSGITAEDLDLAVLYDNFTPAVVFAIEGIGICGQGESGDWLLSGKHRRSGALPINTSGGHLSEGYMQGWANTVEAVRQLRGEAGERQVAGVELALDLTCSPLCSAAVLAR